MILRQCDRCGVTQSLAHQPPTNWIEVASRDVEFTMGFGLENTYKGIMSEQKHRGRNMYCPDCGIVVEKLLAQKT